VCEVAREVNIVRLKEKIRIFQNKKHAIHLDGGSHKEKASPLLIEDAFTAAGGSP